MALNNLGEIYYALHCYRDALHFYRQSLTIRHEVGDRRGEGVALNNLGELDLDMGLYDDAPGHLLRALPIRREMRDKRRETMTLFNLGRVNRQLEQQAAALSFSEQALPSSLSCGGVNHARNPAKSARGGNEKFSATREALWGTSCW